MDTATYPNIKLNQYEIHDGLSLSLIEAQPGEDILLDFEIEENSREGVALSFYHTGTVSYILDSFIEDYCFRAGQNGFNYVPLPNKVRICLPRQPLFTSVQFLVLPVFFEEWEAELQKQSYNEYKKLLFNKDHFSIYTSTQPMQLIIQQILNCKYTGLLQKIFLEAKSLELVALYLAYLNESHSSPNRIKLNTGDISRLHEVKELLVQNFTNPPTLLEICRTVGLNEHKLQGGFRELFGTTVFDYLQNFKMEQAKTALDNRTLSIGQIANQVGYTNFSHFAAAFRRKYGVNPRAYATNPTKDALLGHKDSLSG